MWGALSAKVRLLPAPPSPHYILLFLLLIFYIHARLAGAHLGQQVDLHLGQLAHDLRGAWSQAAGHGAWRAEPLVWPGPRRPAPAGCALRAVRSTQEHPGTHYEDQRTLNPL